MKIGVSEKQFGDFKAFFLVLFLCQMRIQNVIEKALLRHIQVSLNRKILAEERKNKKQKTVKLHKKTEQPESPLKPTAF